MSVEENDPPKRLRGQIIRSGVHGDYTITREAVEEMLEQIQAAPKPVNIEHDPTVPPVGRMTNPKLIELDDGEVAAPDRVAKMHLPIPAGAGNTSTGPDASQATRTSRETTDFLTKR